MEQKCVIKLCQQLGLPNQLSKQQLNTDQLNTTLQVETEPNSFSLADMTTSEKNKTNPVSLTAKHSWKFYVMISSEFPNTPDYLAVVTIDDVMMGSYNINMKTLEPQQDWVREFIKDDPRQWETYTKNCVNYQQILIDETRIFKQHSNEIEGMLFLLFT